MRDYVDKGDYKRALNAMREVVAVIAYMNHPTVNGILARELNEARTELGRAHDAWVAQGNPDEHAQRVWSYYVRDHFHAVGLFAQNFTTTWHGEMVRFWGPRTGIAGQVLEASSNLARTNFTINMDDVD
jgi:hypothetical protein